jgi:hypothetical protein
MTWFKTRLCFTIRTFHLENLTGAWFWFWRSPGSSFYSRSFAEYATLARYSKTIMQREDTFWDLGKWLSSPGPLFYCRWFAEYDTPEILDAVCIKYLWIHYQGTVTHAQI